MNVSSENAENVVKPPQIPVIQKSRAADAGKLAASQPINPLPITFTASVPHGNPAPIQRTPSVETPYRAAPPNALPNATSTQVGIA